MRLYHLKEEVTDPRGNPSTFKSHGYSLSPDHLISLIPDDCKKKMTANSDEGLEVFVAKSNNPFSSVWICYYVGVFHEN